MNTSAEESDFEALVAGVVHDSKNGLAIALEQLDTLSELHADAPTARASAAIRDELESVNSKLVSLLRLYRLGKRSYPMNLADHVVAGVLDEVSLRYAAVAESHGIALQVDCADTLIGTFDENLILNVLGDAVHNALRKARSAVRLHAEAEGSGVLLAVEDDGPGYPPSVLQHEVAMPLPAASNDGTGIGLRLARVVARLHRRGERLGRVMLDNCGPDGGARLQLHLP